MGLDKQHIQVTTNQYLLSPKKLDFRYKIQYALCYDDEYCRFILIKYADRGLVKNGKISKLFDCLYLTIASAFTVLLCMTILSRHFRGYEVNNSYMKICLQEEYTNDFENWRIVIQMTAFIVYDFDLIFNRYLVWCFILLHFIQK